jgi:D-alanyl-D-alanine carboxypeptidase
VRDLLVHGGDIMGYMTRNAVNADGTRSVVVSVNTDSPKRERGVAAPKHDMTLPLIDRALCG